VKRREFIAGLGGAVAWPLTVHGQPAVPVVGVLNTVSAADWKRPMSGFHRGLSEMGFVEGRNVAIEYRWAEGRLDQMPALAADLVGRKVAVVLANAIPAARVVMAATKTIPIVFTTTTDPVAVGLVASLNRPDGNVTGVTGLLSELLPKGLQLLRQVIPTATRFAALVNPGNRVTTQDTTEGGQTAARRLGLEILVLKASNENEIEAAFADAVEQRAGALFFADIYFESRRDQIAALGLRHALPVMRGGGDGVVAGGLMSYGVDVLDHYRQAGVYVGRILKGEKPSDLPVQQATKFEFVINLKTAKALGLTIPPQVLALADEVIE